MSMIKTAKKVTDLEADASQKLLHVLDCEPAMTMAAIFNTMRILKRVNPGDAYYENYLSMRARYGAKFFDTYQLLWGIGVYLAPKRILEIGVRTGISLCQLLSAHKDLRAIERIVCVDPFDQWTSASIVRANLKHLNLPHTPEHVEILAMKSEDYYPTAIQNEDTFDYVLVDGDHTKEVARKDLDYVHQLVEHGGVIVFDDISTAPGECALIDVWEAWKTEHLDEYVFTEVMEGKGVAIAVKI